MDCNLGALAGIAAGAIKVYGTHILIQRVRAINFGTRSTAQKGMVIATAGADPSLPEPYDCIVADCVIEQPYDSNVRETTCVSLNARENSNGVMAYHRACVIRNCTINCEYVSKPLAISSITYSGTTATADTTPFQHGLSGTPWVLVTGALENSVISTKYNGSFQALIDEMEAEKPKLVGLSRLRAVRHGDEFEQWVKEHYEELPLRINKGVYLRKQN